MLEKNINTNTVIGTIVGVGVGRYILQSKSVLFLTVFGIASGLLTNYVINNYIKKSKEDQYLEEIEENITFDDGNSASHEDITDGLDMDISSNFYGVNEQMVFNRELGYHVPLNRVIPIEKPSNYMDLE